MKKLLLPLRHVSCFHPISCYHSLFIFFAFFCHYHYKSFMAEQPVMEFTDWNESIYFQIMMDAKKISKVLLDSLFQQFERKKIEFSKFEQLKVVSFLVAQTVNFKTLSLHQSLTLRQKYFSKHSFYG